MVEMDYGQSSPFSYKENQYLLSSLARSSRIGSRLVDLGNSITIAGETVTGGTPQYSESYGSVAALLSQGKLSRVYNAGKGGDTSGKMLARFDTDVTPFCPTIVTIMEAANDGNAGTSLAQYMFNIRSIVEKCYNIGATPVLLTSPPVNYASGTSQETLHRSYNSWLRVYAARNNILLVDFYAIMADPALRFTNKAGFVNGDGIHPNTAGQRLLGAELWNKLSTIVTPGSPILTQENIDPYNLVDKGLFLTDTNADGVADNWSVASSPSAGTFSRSIVNDSNVVGGKMQRLSVTGATGANTIEQYLQLSGGHVWLGGVGVTDKGLADPGDVLRFAGVVTSTGGTRAQAFLNFAGGKYVTWLTDNSITRGIFEVEITIPTGSSLLQTQLTASGGTGSVDFGQVTLYNLTKQSMLIANI